MLTTEPPEPGAPRDGRLARRSFWGLFAAAAICALLPLARTRILPLLDEPNHLAAVTIVHELTTPGKNLSAFYDAKLELVPYVAYHSLVHGLAFLIGIEWANKLVLGAYVLSIPVAALLWTRRTRRSPYLAFLTFPLAYSASWAFGFHPFNVAVAFFPFASVAVDALLERPSVWLALTTLLLSVGCALGHPLAAIALAVSVLVLVVAHRPRLSSLVAALLALAPSGVLSILAVVRPGVDWVKPPAGSTGVEVKRLSAEALVRWFPNHTMDSVSGTADTTVFWVLVVCLAALLVSDLTGQSPAPPSVGQVLRDHRTTLVGLAMLALYFVVPFELVRPFAWWWVGLRYAPLACFFLFLAPRATLARMRAALLAPAVACAFVLPLHVSEKYAGFHARIDPFLRLVESTPEGANVLCLRMGWRGDEAVNVAPYDQIGAWVQVLRGGYSQAGWHDTATVFRTKRALPAPPYWQHEQFDPGAHAASYDYVLVRNEVRPLFHEGDPFRLARTAGEWKLYERVTSRNGGVALR